MYNFRHDAIYDTIFIWFQTCLNLSKLVQTCQKYNMTKCYWIWLNTYDVIWQDHIISCWSWNSLVNMFWYDFKLVLTCLNMSKNTKCWNCLKFEQHLRCNLTQSYHFLSMLKLTCWHVLYDFKLVWTCPNLSKTTTWRNLLNVSKCV